ncbi:MAG: amidohydrolase [Candidatus Bathyarchaeia archaeon]
MIKLKPNFILKNGKIVTVDGQFSIQDAVAIADKWIIAVGSDREVCKLGTAKTKEIDLKGKIVIPGFIDTHVHLTSAAPQFTLPSLEEATSIADITRVIENEAKKSKSGEWIVTRPATVTQLSTNLRERRLPNRWDLDSAAPNNPVYVGSGPLGIVNTYTLKLLGITKDTPQPEGGEIKKDPVTGEPTGVLEGAGAMELVTRHLPPLTREHKKSSIMELCGKFNSWGVTTVVNVSAYLEDFAILQELRLENKLTIRMDLLHAIDYPETLPLEENLAIIRNLSAFAYHRGFGDDMLKISGIGEIIFNGIMPEEKLKQISLEAAKHHLRVGAHAHHPQGGKALENLLNIWSEVNNEVPLADRQFFLLHGSFTDKNLCERVKKLKLAVSCQPSFLYNMYDLFRALDPSRTPMPLREWLDSSIPISFGTDYPFSGGYEYPTGGNPMFGIYNAISRKIVAGDVRDPEQKITREEALRCYTINGAYAIFEEKTRGSIEPGKLADLVILDRDILTCPEEEIKKTKVLMTICDGRIVYEMGW